MAVGLLIIWIVQRRVGRNERSFMMNQTGGWMGGWFGGGMWILPVIGILVVVLLVVVITKMSNKKS